MKNKGMKLFFLSVLLFIPVFFSACGGDDESDNSEYVIPDDGNDNNSSTTGKSDFTYSQFVGTWTLTKKSENGQTTTMDSKKDEWGVKFYSDNKTGQFYHLSYGSAWSSDFKWWLEEGDQMRIVDLDGNGVETYYTIMFLNGGKELMMYANGTTEYYTKYK